MPVAEQRGGAEAMLLQLLRYHQAEDMEWVVVFTEAGPMIAQVECLGITTFHVAAGQLRSPRRYVGTVKKIAAIVRSEKADGILSWMAKPHLYGAVAARLAKVPALWYQLGTPSNHWIDRVATWLPAAGILACSRSVANAQRQLPPARQVHVVFPGVDLERFDPDVLPTPGEARQLLNLPAEGPIVGMVGRLQRWKGMHVLIKAMPAILDHYPAAHCVIVGGQHPLEPDYRAYLDKLVAELGLGDTVTMVGLHPNSEIWMQAMDVVVHASDNEPFGLVVIEAMALAKPVVAGAGGGPTEIITDGIDGLLTAYGDENAMSSAILRCLDSPDFAREIGALARARAAEFATPLYARKVSSVVREALGND